MALPRNAFSLRGKFALVSGGGSGTGPAVAVIPPARGSPAEVNHRNGRDRAAAMVAKIALDRARVVGLPAAMTDLAAAERTFPAGSEQRGRWTFLSATPPASRHVTGRIRQVDGRRLYSFATSNEDGRCCRV